MFSFHPFYDIRMGKTLRLELKCLSFYTCIVRIEFVCWILLINYDCQYYRWSCYPLTFLLNILIWWHWYCKLDFNLFYSALICSAPRRSVFFLFLFIVLFHFSQTCPVRSSLIISFTIPPQSSIILYATLSYPYQSTLPYSTKSFADKTAKAVRTDLSSNYGILDKSFFINVRVSWKLPCVPAVLVCDLQTGTTIALDR